MGNRIHKSLGYAAYHPDIKNLKSRLWDNETSGEVLKLIDDEYQRMIDEGNRCISLAMDTTRGFTNWKLTPPNFFSDVVRYADHPDSENSPFLIIPPAEYKRWYRYDDMMDYTEAFSNNPDEPCDTLHKWIETPLYPYLNWMNKNTGEIRQNYNKMWDGPDPDLVPAIPESVKIIAKHLGFNWLELRPMIAIWWC